VSWQRAPDTIVEINQEYSQPYWAITTHADVRAVSRDAETYCSSQGVLFEGVHPDLLEASQSFLQMDAPRHTRVRGLVNAAFTPRQVARIERDIAKNAKTVVDELMEHGPECDFVEHVAKRLPMMTIFDMIGVPEADRERLRVAADLMVSFNDEDVTQGEDPLELVFQALLDATAAALDMAEHRADHPGDDLMSALVHTEIDGERLLPEEIGAFFVLLSVAGNDTTRHTTSHALRALTEHPDQRAVLMDGLPERLPTSSCAGQRR
jgi:cytochrome P450